MWRSVTCGQLRFGDLIQPPDGVRQLLVLRVLWRPPGRVHLTVSPAVGAALGDSDDAKSGGAAERVLMPAGQAVLRWEE